MSRSLDMIGESTEKLEQTTETHPTMFVPIIELAEFKKQLSLRLKSAEILDSTFQHMKTREFIEEVTTARPKTILEEIGNSTANFTLDARGDDSRARQALSDLGKKEKIMNACIF